MRKTKNLKKIINQHDLCISKNPFGITRSWPNSFIDEYYNQFCHELFIYKKSPNILEINQENENNIRLWELYFEKIKVDKYSINQTNQNSFSFVKNYDLIIFNKFETFYKISFFQKLLKLLTNKGVFIIENVNNNISFIYLLNLFISSFYKYELELHDFRLKKYINSNTLLVIKKKQTFRLAKNIFFLINFLKFSSINIILWILNSLTNISIK